MAETDPNEDTNDNSNETTLRTHDFELVLTQNYQLFAIMGVFGALSVYLFDLREGAATQHVDWGIAGALMMFIVSSFVLVYKLTYILANYGKTGVTFRTFMGGVLIGLVAAVFGILGVVSEFFNEIFVLGSLATAVVIYTVYLNWFPWDRFQDVEGVSPTTKEKVKEAPSIANLWVVVAILTIGGLVSSFPEIAGQDAYALILLMIAALPLHYGLSVGQRRWYLSRDDKISDGVDP